jgi:hypothetical protein
MICSSFYSWKPTVVEKAPLQSITPPLVSGYILRLNLGAKGTFLFVASSGERLTYIFDGPTVHRLFESSLPNVTPSISWISVCRIDSQILL